MCDVCCVVCAVRWALFAVCCFFAGWLSFVVACCLMCVVCGVMSVDSCCLLFAVWCELFNVCN